MPYLSQQWWEMYVGKDFLKEYAGKIKGTASGTNPDGSPKFSKNPTSGDEGKSMQSEWDAVTAASKKLTEGKSTDFSGSLSMQQARSAAEVFKGRQDYVEMK